MKSKFITDPQDPSDGFDFLDTVEAEVYSNFTSRGSSFSPPAPQDVGSPPSSDPFEIPSTALVSEAVQASGAQTGATTTLALTTGGITINLLFDAAAMAAPASFRAGIQQAASLLTAAISDKIIVNIKIDYSGTGGGAAAGPDNGQYVSYSTVRSDLVNSATPGDPVFNALPSGSSFQTQSSVAVWNAQLKLWGILGANDTTTDDGSATFATDINSNLLVGVALHELTHAMGRVPYGPPYGSQPDIFDLFRFTSPGTQLIDGASTAPAAYFSVDRGNTRLADYGQNSDPSDFLNSGVQGGNDPFNEYYTASTSQALTTVDKEQLDALGFHALAPVATTVIESFGSTSLVEVGNNFYLKSNSSGSGPELQFGNVPVAVSGQSGTWSPIGAEQTASGHEVAWKVIGVDQYTVWNTDSSGNYVSNAIGNVSGTNSTLEALETSFHQDLNGDGVIGPPPVSATVIESFGSTSLVEVGNNFYLKSNSSGSGPELQFGNVPVAVSGQSGTWSPIGAEQTASGHEVAWKVIGVDQYTVWNTDSSGNYVSNAIGNVSGTNSTLEALETSFHQDLNGDGVIGPPPVSATVIESFGSTSLVEVGNNFYLKSNSSGSGPELQFGNVPVAVSGQSGTWSPIGAEQTASGHEVAWKVIGVDQYTVWNTDSSGNYVSNAIGNVSGTNSTLEALETSFHQDLNGDGVIGPPPVSATVIESFGSTSLVEVGNNFYLKSNSSGSGPELQFGNVPVAVSGQSGTWSPIGAEQTASGHEVAWKVIGVDQYTVWNTDSSGNYVSNAIGNVSGTNSTLEALETSFHQDLNGDGVIGPPPVSATVIESFGSTSLVEVGNNFYLKSNSSGSGPELQFGNVPVAVSGQSGTWSPIGAEQTASGHEVAWKVIGVDQYTVWNTDSSGNYVSNAIGNVSGTNSTLEALETSFHQDLNGDGIIGASPSPTSATPVGASSINLFAAAGQDSFVFTPNSGQKTIDNFDPYHDTIKIDHKVFADVAALMAHTSDNSSGNAVIAANAHDTVTIVGVTTDMLQHHLNDFIIS